MNFFARLRLTLSDYGHPVTPYDTKLVPVNEWVFLAGAFHRRVADFEIDTSSNTTSTAMISFLRTLLLVGGFSVSLQL